MRSRLDWLAAGLLVLAVAIVYGRTLSHGFLTLDDGLYITGNPHVRGGITWENVCWAFSEREYASFYHPLTWLSILLDVELWGIDGTVFGLPAAGFHHLTNVLLHAASSVLVFVLLRLATGRIAAAFAVAALFALHPLHVESVAWAAERKDTLSTCLGLACLVAYVRYARAPSGGRYVAVLALLVLGLLAKPMLVTWPFVMLLLDWWPLGRLQPLGPRPAVGETPARRPLALVGEKLPFFALVAVSSVLAYSAQTGQAMPLMARLTLGERLQNALLSSVYYLVDTVWPTGLAPFHPHAPLSIPLVAAAGVLVLGVTIVALRSVRSRPWLAVGWAFYLGTLVPVSGIVQVGLHARADRYTYVPLLGVFVAIAWGAGALVAGRPAWRRSLSWATAVALLVLAALSYRQVGYWRDSVTLFEHTLAVEPASGWVRRGLGTAYGEVGRSEEAIVQLEAALAEWPEDPRAHARLGQSLAALGRLADAEREFAAAAELAPDDALNLSNLGTTRMRRG
ncbi:MAG: tetratricopeptide repeat protein, partial [Planctomycetes bacterium]|nr:tetratricopeptide repeat protein [Planctomycetota bacterium]